jgi:hypothetical protein
VPLRLQNSREWTKRVCALLLLVLSVTPYLVVFAAQGAIAEAALPVCCRTHGKHQCFMRLARQGQDPSTSSRIQLSQISERCPYTPSRQVSPHNNSFDQRSRDLPLLGLSTVSTISSHIEGIWTPFVSPANRKRGPPSPATSLEYMNDWFAVRLGLPQRWRQNASIEIRICVPVPDSDFPKSA